MASKIPDNRPQVAKDKEKLAKLDAEANELRKQIPRVYARLKRTFTRFDKLQKRYTRVAKQVSELLALVGRPKRRRD